MASVPKRCSSSVFTASYQPQQLPAAPIPSKLLAFAPASLSHSHLPTALQAPLLPIIVLRATALHHLSRHLSALS